ncbi:hypothetical protein, partial [Okeania sp. SIO2G5]|uniref:hypothetical protein n=1 Tax=Okeania sp. SIO2G5 TaxID=2607796 RepID=UPI00257EF066
GWATVIFVFLCITGIVIWVPQKAKAWRQGLKITSSCSGVRNSGFCSDIKATPQYVVKLIPPLKL